MEDKPSIDKAINAIKKSIATLITRVKARCRFTALDPSNLMPTLHSLHIQCQIQEKINPSIDATLISLGQKKPSAFPHTLEERQMEKQQ
jgi:hypothetical protein